MPYRDTAEYRRKAKECLLRAKATDDVLLKMHFLELADTWKRLAKRTERVESMVGVSAGITKTGLGSQAGLDPQRALHKAP
jgi:hypothetical protein